MSAGISLMYRHSGGCDRENTCAKCGYIESESLKSGTQYRCALHRNITGENQLWKSSYVACKRFQPKAVRPTKSKPKQKQNKNNTIRIELKESESGQLSFL